MLEPAMFIGLGLVAVWAYDNYARLRPGSLICAVVHVIVSYGGFALLPADGWLCLPTQDRAWGRGTRGASHASHASAWEPPGKPSGKIPGGGKAA